MYRLNGVRTGPGSYEYVGPGTKPSIGCPSALAYVTWTVFSVPRMVDSIAESSGAPSRCQHSQFKQLRSGASAEMTGAALPGANRTAIANHPSPTRTRAWVVRKRNEGGL